MQHLRGRALGAAALLTLQTSQSVCEPAPLPKFVDKKDIAVHVAAPKASGWLPSFSGLWSYYWPSADDAHFAKYGPSSDQVGLMSWPTLQDGLKKRADDEVALRALTNEAIAAAKANDVAKMNALRARITVIAYGDGVTPEARQAHLEKYGCVMYTDAALDAIATAARHTRGILELGAGNGQWAKQLRAGRGLDVLAFDNMAALPLNPAFFRNTTLNMEFCAADVMKGDASIFTSALAPKLAGRALLIVFPDPGPMARRCVEAYTKSSDENTVFIYVGEGRGGANGDDAFFDVLERDWVLQQSMGLPSFSKKGYERLFVFTKRAPK
ncbi:hypothetical protein SDRG_09238 [Saprolegnia diclina VS20]|uniref:Methyltransferase domain-containing protein n=1 Tax=Saprolegnia diclina (strain VS20) TaxID=1156394 RepID=T0QET1_SAPDV|nr:hypothetical protein SDRG_09238 [Saprolegnia diclina VS20]EQC33256.1 hypothetical protein SDRG_09238 [Saprolegnia diclina VS20]|eukprot:XP_008613379.1 hypothetical protein SDRG_09238 [Saprolegnia diclina VS20]